MVRPRELLPLGFLSVALATWEMARVYLDHSTGIMVFSCIVLLVAYRRIGRPVRVPRFVSIFIVLVGIGMLAMSILLLRLEPGKALAYFLTAAILIKSFSIGKVSDFSELMILSVMAMLAAGAVTPTTEFAVVLVAYVALAGYWLYKTHLVVEAMAHRQFEGAAGRGIAVQVRRRTWISGYFVTAVLTCSISLAIFVLIPRGSPAMQLLGNTLTRQSTRTGFGEQLTLGEMTILMEDDDPVLRVKVLSDSKSGVAPLMYLRGSVKTQYSRHGQFWKWLEEQKEGEERVVQTRSLDTPVPIQDAAMLSKEAVAKQIFWRIYYDDEISSNLFVIDTPTAIATNREMRLTYCPQTNTLRASQYPKKGFCYKLLTSHEAPAQNIWPKAPTAGDVERTVRRETLPMIARFRAHQRHRVGGEADLDRYQEKAQEVLAKEARELSPLEQARKLEMWLRTSGEFRYDLDNRDVLPQIDPVFDFLTRRKHGHCEYFASAFVLLCRSLGLEARIVTGFKNGGYNYNAFGGYYTIRNCDAHAWAEVYLDGKGWTTFDPTPAARDEAIRPVESKLVRMFWDAVDLLRFTWLSHLANYDESERREFIEGLRKQILGDETGEAGQTWTIKRVITRFIDMLRGEDYQSRWHQVLHWIVVVLLIAFAYLIVRISVLVSTKGLRRFRRYLAKRWERKYGNVWTCPIDFYRGALVTLAKRGITKPVTRTAWEFTEDLRLIRADVHPEMVDLTRAYLRMRFGEAKLAPEERSILADQLDSLQKKLAGVAHRQAR